MNTERMKILEMLESGAIDAAQAAALLESLAEPLAEAALELTMEEDPAPLPGFSPDAPQSDPRSFSSTESHTAGEEAAPAGGRPSAFETPDFSKWRGWWTTPLAFGVGVVALAGWLMYVGFREEWGAFWVGCLWLPLLLGVTLTTLAWLSRSALWLHVRVNTGQDEWPRRIAVSFPIPVRLTTWGLKTFGHFIPNLDHRDIDEIVLAVGDALRPEDPLYVEVEQRDKGEKVQVFIG